MKHAIGTIENLRQLRYVDARLAGYPREGTFFKADMFIRNGVAYYPVDDELIARKFIIQANPAYCGIDATTAATLIGMIDNATEQPGFLDDENDKKVEEEFPVLMLMRLVLGM